MKLLEKFPVRPISPTKMAHIKNLLIRMEEFFQEIEKIEKTGYEENMMFFLKAAKEAFSESIENFKSLDLDDKLLSLARESFKTGLICMNILKKSLKKEVTSEINELMKKSGLLCGLVA